MWLVVVAIGLGRFYAERLLELRFAVFAMLGRSVA